jgi:hypothetical protein
MCPTEIGVIILIIIIGLAVSIMIRKQAITTASSMTEGFTTNTPQRRQPNFPNITFCPFNSTAVITNAGETLCCQGETSTKLGCLQKTVCSLSNSQGKNYGPCSKVYGEYIQNKSRLCPRSLPSYFEKRDPSNKNIVSERGCYAGPTHPQKYEPVSPQQKKCIDYINSEKDNELNIHSCWNQAYLSVYQIAVGNWFKKSPQKIYKDIKLSLVKLRDNAPPLLQITTMIPQKAFGGAVDMPEITYTWASIVRYWKYTWPDYSKYNFDDLAAEDMKLVFEVNDSLRFNNLKPRDKKIVSSYLKLHEKIKVR